MEGLVQIPESPEVFEQDEETLSHTEAGKPSLFQVVGSLQAVRASINAKIADPELNSRVRRAVDAFAATQCKPGDTLAVEVFDANKTFFDLNMKEVLDPAARISGSPKHEETIRLAPGEFQITVARAESKGEDNEIEMMLRKLAYLQHLIKAELAPGLAEMLGKESGRQQMAMKRVEEINRDIKQISAHVKLFKNGPVSEEQRQTLAKMLTALETKVNKLAAMPGLKAIMAAVLNQVKELRQSSLLGLTNKSLPSIAPRVAAVLNNKPGIHVDPKNTRTANTALPRQQATALARLGLSQLTRPGISLHSSSAAQTAANAAQAQSLASRVGQALGTAAATAGAMVIGATTATPPLAPQTVNGLQANMVQAEPAAMDKAGLASTTALSQNADQPKDLSTSTAALAATSNADTVNGVTTVETTQSKIVAEVARTEALKQDALEQPKTAEPAAKAPEQAKEIVADVARVDVPVEKKAEAAPERPADPVILGEVPREKTVEATTAQQDTSFFKAPGDTASFGQTGLFQSTGHQQYVITTTSLMFDSLTARMSGLTDKAREDISRNFKKNAADTCEGCQGGRGCPGCVKGRTLDPNARAREQSKVAQFNNGTWKPQGLQRG